VEDLLVWSHSTAPTSFRLATPACPVLGRLCWLSYAAMLFICWLIFEGALEQTKINWDSTSAVMETSMGYFYASGVVFAVLAAPILLFNFWRLISGQMADKDLIGIRENEDMPTGDPHP
jgi:TRAP-type C4-dicarboxylate transport system permease small subunit